MALKADEERKARIQAIEDQKQKEDEANERLRVLKVESYYSSEKVGGWIMSTLSSTGLIALAATGKYVPIATDIGLPALFVYISCGVWATASVIKLKNAIKERVKIGSSVKEQEAILHKLNISRRY